MSATAEKEIVVAGMLQCKQKQWTSGVCKEKYCEKCPDKETCFEVLGR